MVENFNSLDVGLVAVVGGLSLGLVFLLMVILSVVAAERRKAAQTREFEQSRREVAAYVAEGTITPDDAARILAVGRKGKLSDILS